MAPGTHGDVQGDLCECRVFTAGSVGHDGDGNLLVPTGFVAQCEQVSFKAGNVLDVALPQAVCKTGAGHPVSNCSSF